MERLSDYLQDRLVDHIKKEMRHGYKMEDIKEALLNYHKKDVIHEALMELKKERFSVAHKKKRFSKRLDKDLFYKVVDDLQHYILRQRKRGYSSKQIRDAMLRYGHTKDTVNAAIDAVEFGKIPEYVEPFGYESIRVWMFPLGVLTFLAGIFWLSFAVQESPMLLSLVFLPILFTFVLNHGVYRMVSKPQVLLAVPLLATLMMYAVMVGVPGSFGGVEAERISGLNLIVSFFYTLLYVGVAPEVEVTRISEEEEIEILRANPKKDEKVLQSQEESMEEQIEKKLRASNKLVPVELKRH